MFFIKRRIKVIKIKRTIKEVLIFLFFVAFAFAINNKYDILALFIDDLNSFTYFPNTNIFEFAFKFYENMTRYRPFYEFFQYIAFFVAGHNPHILFVINVVFNAFIAFYISLFVKSISNDNILPIVVGVLYLISHFSCYQINQALGLMESIATLLSIYILCHCFIFIKNISIKEIVKIMIAYFCIILTHERYIVLIGIIIFSLFMSIVINEDDKTRKKTNLIIVTMAFFLVIIGLFLIMILRYKATGKFIPAGTSGTRVEETFELSKFFKYVMLQLKFIFGFNAGDEASCGVTYDMLKNSTKLMISLQIFFIVIYIFLYIILKIRIIATKLINTLDEQQFKIIVSNIWQDLLFVGFILSCICVSSITVMLEIRFIYVSFIAFIIYLIYMYAYIKKEYYVKKIEICLTVSIVLFLSLFLRCSVEFRYRDGNDNIHYMIDQRRLNSLAKETVCKYGNEILDNKKICILNNSFIYTKRYSKYLMQIYQKDYQIREIEFINSMDDLKKFGIEEENAIVIVEDKKNDRYYEFKERR